MQLWVLATGTCVSQTLIFGRTECHAPAQVTKAAHARSERNRRPSPRTPLPPPRGKRQTLADNTVATLADYIPAYPAYPPQR
jgi:hypothetical protein